MLLFAIFVSIEIYGNKYNKVVLVDPVSKSEIVIPNGCIVDSSSTKYKKYDVSTTGSYISLFSVENPNSCSYSWNKLNEFEKEWRLGSLIEKKRLPEPADGWIRIFQSKNSKGHNIYHSLTLVRGNIYALYLLETGSKREDLITPDVAISTDFKDICDKRVDNDGVITWRTTLIHCLILLLVGLLKALKIPMSAKLKHSLLVVITFAYFCGMYFYALFPLKTSILVTISLTALLYIILKSKSWTDFWDMLEKHMS